MLYPCQVVLFFGAALQQVAVTRGMRTKTLGSGSYLLEGVSECMLGTMTWGEQNSEAEAFAQLVAQTQRWRPLQLLSAGG